MDTVTLIRSAIRGVLRVADVGLGVRLRGVLARDDDYGSAGKPVCDYDDPAAREALVDALAKDAHAVLLVLDGGVWEPGVEQAGRLLATVVGQDLDEGSDGVFRIARRVAKDRVISTVDPQARHGHKTAARGFDGYKGHVGIDPDSEIITGTTATAGNVGDADAAMDLLADDLPAKPADTKPFEDESASDLDDLVSADGDGSNEAGAEDDSDDDQLHVYGDAAYGAGELQERFEDSDIANRCKVQPASAPQGGLFSKDEFDIDLQAGTVGCPAGQRADPARSWWRRDRRVRPMGRDCPLASQCTSAAAGRTVRIGARTSPRAGTSRAGRSGLAGRLPCHPAQGRTQDRAPDAASPRRPPGPGPWSRPRSPPTSPCSLPGSTWPDSACSDCTKPPAKAGKSRRHDSKNTAAQQIPHRSR